jgi:Lecithin:cholesterol acyltransferase
MRRSMSRTRRVLRWLGRGTLAGSLFIAVFVGVLVLIDRGETYGCGDIAGTRAEAFTISASARDLTPELDALRTDGRIDPAKLSALVAPQADRIAALNVLVVPGYLTDFLALPGAIGLSDYLDSQESALRPLARSVARIDLETEASVAENAKAIARVVAATDGPICLVSHSKGGDDTLHFLLQASATEREKIACWITFQTPFAGSPIADLAADYGVVREPAEFLLGVFGGEGRSLHDHRTGLAGCYLASHDTAIAEIAGAIPIVSVAGAIDADAAMGDKVTPFLPSLMLMQRQGIRSDGLVPTASAVLPHASYVIVAPLDHTGAVAKGATALPYAERERLTQALIALALQPAHEQ